MLILFFWIVFTAIVGTWAKTWGRSVFTSVMLSLFLSPLIAAIALAVDGKSLEKKAEEQVHLDELKARIRQTPTITAADVLRDARRLQAEMDRSAA